MAYFGACWSPGDGVISTSALALLRSVCGPHTILRCGPSLPTLFPTPEFNDANYGVIDSIYANCVKAGVDVYSNATDIPSHATSGVPLYQTGMGGSAAWWLSTQLKLGIEQIQKVFDLTRDLIEQNTVIEFLPPNPPWITALRTIVQPDPNDSEFKRVHEWHFDHNYRGEREHTWAWNEPLKGGGPWHVYGDPGFAEADRISAYRPWLTNREQLLAAKIDTGWLYKAAQVQMKRWGHMIHYAGFGNEFGGVGYNIDIRFDGANNPNDPTAPDTVKTRLVPALNAYYSGLWDVFDGPLVGFEADGGDILRRCAEESTLPDIITYHPYDLNGGTAHSIERFRDDFRPQLNRFAVGGVGEAIGEIGDDDSVRLLQFIDNILKERPQTQFVIVLKIGYFIDGDLTTDNVRLSKVGEDARNLLIKHNQHRRTTSHV